MIIRQLSTEDAGEYRELWLMSLRENPESFAATYETEDMKPIEQFERNLSASEFKFTLGAFHEGRLSGVVTFVRESSPKTEHKGNVYGVFVKPACRGQGIAKALMRELIARAEGISGLEQINLAVISGNAAARGLYASLGFVTFGTERNALKTGNRYWDEDWMTLRLK